MSFVSQCKRCSQCNEFKALAHFTRRKDGRTKLLFTSCCKECRRKNYGENPQTIRDRSNAHYHVNKILILQGLRAKYARNPALALIKAAKSRAKHFGVPFSLREEDVVIPAVCPVLGIPLVTNSGKSGRNSPSLDRLIGSRGYVRGNVVVVSLKANTIKSDATLAELKAVVAFYDRMIPRFGVILRNNVQEIK